MSFNASMSFKGEKQGAFQGNSRLKGIHAGKSILGATSYGNSISPTNSIIGPHSGKRQHQPITIRKEVDAASPQLLAALCTNEALSGKIDLVKTGFPSCTIELSGGVISGIKPVPPVTKGRRGGGGAGTNLWEDVSIVFQSINVPNIGHISLQDSLEPGE